jgi:hypothetical protein
MPRSSNPVGEKTRPVVAPCATRREEPQATAGTKTRRKIPASYLAKHPCKVCRGELCVGNCRF